MQPRDYQQYTVNTFFEYFEGGGTGHPVICMPTGTGKSPVLGWIIKEALSRYPYLRILKLTHVKELIEQNYEKLRTIWPTAPVGIYSSGLRKRDSFNQITYAGIASVYDSPELFGHIDLIFIDECHLLSTDNDSMYRKFINALLKVNPHLKVIGLTATAYRMKQGMIIDPGGLFTEIIVDLTTRAAFNWFIDQGYLVNLVPRPTKTEIDTSSVAIQGGEFSLNQLQAVSNKEEITYAAIKETLEIGGDRNHWMVFATGIEHVEATAAMMDSFGIPTTFVHSKLKSAERDKRIKAFRNQEYRAMVNNGILTTGYDDPAIDLIVGLRATNSPGLWVQMLGRGTRPLYEDGYDLTTTEGRLASIASSVKKDCLVLDFAANTPRLGPINDPVVPSNRRKKGGNVPIKLCEHCGTYNHSSVRICTYCGAEFPLAVKFSGDASTSALIARGLEEAPIIEKFTVDRVTYQLHKSTKDETKPPSLKATYYCGYRVFTEWVNLEHTGFPRRKAKTWWLDRTLRKDKPIPDKIVDAIARIDELLTPIAIDVWVNKKYPDIMNYTYYDDGDMLQT